MSGSLCGVGVSRRGLARTENVGFGIREGVVGGSVIVIIVGSEWIDGPSP